MEQFLHARAAVLPSYGMRISQPRRFPPSLKTIYLIRASQSCVMCITRNRCDDGKPTKSEACLRSHDSGMHREDTKDVPAVPAAWPPALGPLGQKVATLQAHSSTLEAWEVDHLAFKL